MAFETSLELAKLQAAVSRWFTGETRQGFFATDLEFRIVVWNRWMEVHSGHTAADVVGRSLFAVYPDVAQRGLKEYYEESSGGKVTVISHGLHRYLLPMPPTNLDLGLRYMPQSGHIGPLSDGESLIGAVTILEDVSDRIASEARLRTQIEAQQRARTAAETALRAKDEFLSTLSHEMRTPLNAVLGWARILKMRDTIDREVIERAVQVIERNASAQAKMIDDMLDMARVVAGKLRLDIQSVDLLSVVLAALDVVMPAAHAKGITVSTALDPKIPRVPGDPDRLQQMIWNLLSNALKFTASGGRVDVRLESARKSVRIVVSDTGQGISPEFLPYVFDRFRQNDSSSARRHGGLGLGLALVRELAGLHGGRVTAASAGEDKGATFTIDLPTGGSPEVWQNHVESAVRGTSAPSLEGVRVLLVDDETDARELAIVALEQSGAHVTAMSSGSDALDALVDYAPEAVPHVLVSDIGMPGQDGYAFIRNVRSLSLPRIAAIPALAMTGYATREDVERTMAAGFQRHVSKPIDPTALVAAVADLFRSATNLS